MSEPCPTESRFGYPLDVPSRQIVRRSMLIMPVNVPAFIAKAHLRGADAIVLEDSIPPKEKDRARVLVKATIAEVGRGGGDVLVRVNRPWPLQEQDLEAVIWPGLAGINYPKPESAEELQRTDATITRLEQERGIAPGTVRIGTSIETVAGFFNVRAIAAASPRLITIGLGSEDFTLDLEIEPTDEGTELYYGKLFMVLLARQAGLYPMGTMRGVANFNDIDGQKLAIRTARSVGYRGSSCIHPLSVPLLNEGFSPTAAETEHARRVIEIYDEAEAQGRASIALDGKMIDIPVAERALRVIARAERVAAFEARKPLVPLNAPATVRACSVRCCAPTSTASSIRSTRAATASSTYRATHRRTICPDRLISSLWWCRQPPWPKHCDAVQPLARAPRLSSPQASPSLATTAPPGKRLCARSPLKQGCASSVPTVWALPTWSTAFGPLQRRG